MRHVQFKEKAVVIRKAEPAERTAAVELTLAAYSEYERGMPRPVFDNYMENIRQAVQSDDRAALWLLFDSGALVASTLFYPAAVKVYSALDEGSPYPEVRLLAVHPDARGRGYAKVLMEHCIALAKAEGASGIGLHTSDLMTSAQALYAKLQFERYPEADFYPTADLCVKGYRLRFGA